MSSADRKYIGYYQFVSFGGDVRSTLVHFAVSLYVTTALEISEVPQIVLSVSDASFRWLILLWSLGGGWKASPLQ